VTSSPPALAAEVARAARRPAAARTLVLDLDGTLAPIAPTPEQARVGARTRGALRALDGAGWRLVVASGRPARQARRMLGLRSCRVFGGHGLEELRPDGRYVLRLSRSAAARLGALRLAARELVRGSPGVRLEVKPTGLALHDRALRGRRLTAWRERLAAWLDEITLGPFEALAGKRVVELRPRTADKGAVVLRLARERGISRRDASFVALGDDATDEQMFAAIRGRGLGVRVGPPAARTQASRRLRSPAAVTTFLEKLSAGEGGRR